MPCSVYMITGQMGSGKDTAIGFLKEDVEDTGCKFAHINFADAIRDVAKILFGLTDFEMQDRVAKETKLERWPFQSPREILRNLGMTLRDLYPGVWINAWQAKVDATDGNTVVGCSDLRFPDEEDHAVAKGYEIWKITRPGFDGDPHPSETHIPLIKADVEIYNEGTLEEFRQLILNI